VERCQRLRLLIQTHVSDQWFSTKKKVPLPLAYTGWPEEWIMTVTQTKS